MTTLEFTKKDVEKWLKMLKGNSAIICAFKDLLILHKLLEDYVDNFPVKSSEITRCVYASQMRDKIRALLEAK